MEDEFKFLISNFLEDVSTHKIKYKNLYFRLVIIKNYVETPLGKARVTDSYNIYDITTDKAILVIKNASFPPYKEVIKNYVENMKKQSNKCYVVVIGCFVSDIKHICKTKEQAQKFALDLMDQRNRVEIKEIDLND